ncbi:pentapeptide repeat-containing protein [Candidatus Poribacteria bacterium]|nr:pentapeptide repeat-containing protein [Candidatus Poribacteria bacterium]
MDNIYEKQDENVELAIEEKLEPLVRHGTQDKRITVSVSEVLDAIVEGRDVNIKYAVIEYGIDVDIKPMDRLERDENGKPTVHGDIRIEHSEIREYVNFNNVIFNGEVYFVGSTFSPADFGGYANYTGAIFDGTIFKGKANFDGATFGGYASFLQATFGNDASFTKTTFDNYVNFAYAIFKGEVDFRDADFGDFGPVVSFHGAIFNRTANFSHATFGGHVSFTDVTFIGTANFVYVTFGAYVDFERATFRRADFSFSTFAGASFRNTAFGEGAYFDDVAIEMPANFANVCFRENTVLAGLWNHILRPVFCPIMWLISWGKVELPKKEVTNFSGVNTITLMNGASNPYLKRYIEDEQWIESWRRREGWKRVLFILWEATSHCGRSFGLWTFWSLVIALSFGLLYKDIPCPSLLGNTFIGKFIIWANPEISVNAPTPDNWYTPFYFSIVTFTTLGFGDVQPANGAGQFWITLEVILGYVMLGGLISIFANKLARRS